MKKEFVTMGMPARIEVVDPHVREKDIDEIIEYFDSIDRRFSTYKQDSELSRINAGAISPDQYSKDMQTIFALCEQTRLETNGYFDIHSNTILDPSGLVKGYAIWQASQQLQNKGYMNTYVEIGGDIQVFGTDQHHTPWAIGIRNPFQKDEIIKVVHLIDAGIATSGTSERGTHIYDPIHKKDADEIASITVIAPSVYDADRYATAAFAMGENGISWINDQPGYEGYAVTKDKRGVYTNGFSSYVH
ncbi:MAG TPA: FAD:protein FMN transferase, partial [Candidatus Andersenbacteria bacterium]|nr:FAD:protein FMN transferase [Candidatus Andersenbacteria bacterium]